MNRQRMDTQLRARLCSLLIRLKFNSVPLATKTQFMPWSSLVFPFENIGQSVKKLPSVMRNFVCPNLSTLSSTSHLIQAFDPDSRWWKSKHGKHRGPVYANSIHWHQIIACGRSVRAQMSLAHLTSTIWFEYLWILDLVVVCFV